MEDQQLGVWHNIDPLAEISRRWSPYVYTYNNPLRFVDPDGMEAQFAGGIDATNSTIYRPDGEVMWDGRNGGGKKDNDKDKNAKGNEKDGNQKGIIRNAPEWKYELHPIKAGMQDISFYLLSLMGINALDDFIADRISSGNNSFGKIFLSSISLGFSLSRFKYAPIEGVSGGEMTIPEGSFSLTKEQWKLYPTAGNVPKPTGPFKMIEGAEYQEALTAKK